MKKIFFTLVCLLCTALLVDTTAFAVTVPKNTPVKVALKRHKSQRTISSANQLQAVITKNVYINGQKVFAKNTPAIIHVTLNDKAKFFCKGGTLILKGVTTTDVKGEERKLNLYKEFKGEDAPDSMKILIFKKGQNVTLYPTDMMTARTQKAFSL